MTEDIKKMVEEEKALMLKEELSLPTTEKEMKSVRFLSDKIVKDVEQSAMNDLDDTKIKDRASKKWTKVKQQRIDNVIDQEDVVANIEKAKNKADRQSINNLLYVLKQEKKRSIKEQKHLNTEQKEMQKQEVASYRWEAYKDTLTKYGYAKTPSNGVFKIIIIIDGVVCFLEGLNKASNKLVKVLKWGIIAGLAVACYYIIKAL